MCLILLAAAVLFFFLLGATQSAAFVFPLVLSLVLAIVAWFKNLSLTKL
ncbi:MAG TPA: hypothetical protein VFN09_11470 [Rhodanobacteraceae bacterium]|nr:hypothetical protein [Rhodanobacteraceae bacterium]